MDLLIDKIKFCYKKTFDLVERVEEKFRRLDVAQSAPHAICVDVIAVIEEDCRAHVAGAGKNILK